MPTANSLNHLLRGLREKLRPGKSLSAVAEEIRLTRAQLSRYETGGIRVPPSEHLEKILAAYKGDPPPDYLENILARYEREKKDPPPPESLEAELAKFKCGSGVEKAVRVFYRALTEGDTLPLTEDHVSILEDGEPGVTAFWSAKFSLMDNGGRLEAIVGWDFAGMSGFLLNSPCRAVILPLSFGEALRGDTLKFGEMAHLSRLAEKDPESFRVADPSFWGWINMADTASTMTYLKAWQSTCYLYDELILERRFSGRSSWTCDPEKIRAFRSVHGLYRSHSLSPARGAKMLTTIRDGLLRLRAEIDEVTRSEPPAVSADK